MKQARNSSGDRQLNNSILIAPGSEKDFNSGSFDDSRKMRKSVRFQVYDAKTIETL